MSIEKAIANATASLEMEGFQVDKKSMDLCRKLLEGKITMEEYIAIVKTEAGVTD